MTPATAFPTLTPNNSPPQRGVRWICTILARHPRFTCTMFIHLKRVDINDMNTTYVPTSNTFISLNSSIELFFLFKMSGYIHPVVEIGIFSITVDLIHNYSITTFYNTTSIHFSKHTQLLSLKFKPYVTYLPEEDVLLFDKKMIRGCGWVTLDADIKWKKWLVGGAERNIHLSCSMSFKTYSSRIHLTNLEGENGESS